MFVELRRECVRVRMLLFVNRNILHKRTGSVEPATFSFNDDAHSRCKHRYLGQTPV